MRVGALLMVHADDCEDINSVSIYRFLDDNLRRLIKSDLWRSLKKMSRFLDLSSKQFEGAAEDHTSEFSK